MIRVILKNNHIKKECRFPCTEEELGNVVKSLYYGGATSPGIFIAKVERPEEFEFLEGKEVNLDELNYLGKLMEGFWGTEFLQFFEALKHEGFTSLKDIINLSFNVNRYVLIQDMSSLEKIGREYFLTVNGAVPANETENPLYAEKGRELIQSGKGILTEHGVLFVEGEIPFTEMYNGQTFPLYLNDPKTVLAVTLRYEDNWETICLPCEELAIKKSCIK